MLTKEELKEKLKTIFFVKKTIGTYDEMIAEGIDDETIKRLQELKIAGMPRRTDGRIFISWHTNLFYPDCTIDNLEDNLTFPPSITVPEKPIQLTQEQKARLVAKKEFRSFTRPSNPASMVKSIVDDDRSKLQMFNDWFNESLKKFFNYSENLVMSFDYGTVKVMQEQTEEGSITYIGQSSPFVMFKWEKGKVKPIFFDESSAMTNPDSKRLIDDFVKNNPWGITLDSFEVTSI